jgi:error-prone DNA polymerase
MESEDRMVADYAASGVTVDRHPMAHNRDYRRILSVCRAGDLRSLRHGTRARIAGCVLARERPGTAHGFIFLSIEDETGIANAIIDPDSMNVIALSLLIRSFFSLRAPFRTSTR